MKILFVLEFFPPAIGGVEKLFGTLTQQLIQNGIGVDVITMKLPGTEKHEKIGGVMVHRIVAPNRYLFTFAAIPKVIRLAKSADIIHTTTYNAAFPAWLGAKLFKKKCIITVHEVLGESWYKLPDLNIFSAWFHKLYEKIILSLSYNRYIAVSEATKKNLTQNIKRSSRKTTRIYNGIDYSLWQNNPKDHTNSPKKFLYYGRSGYTKGLTCLVDAWGLALQSAPDLKLTIMAHPNPKKPYEKLKKHIKKLRLSQKIELKRPVPEQELKTILMSADCVIIPSLTEGFGFNAVENAALGNRMVATYAGAIPEVISGEHILCEPNSPKALARAILQAGENKFQKTPLKKFPLSQTVNETVKLYKTIT